ncbi:unnamed protein product [Caenorhabditis angaria]|uniref:AN1-type domain-containing protein n=1 Tax=Caenorhabditis angaria TaxID=860376 RepID=A0A9P1ITS1_9PELO|nr:unnamed protein product [Caenorhabditis angaria]
MAEFPHFGSHCGVEFCNQLDFLPIKCDACRGEYCTQHFVYDAHNCENAYRKNIQVPVCPMCSQPVPTPKNVPADYQVNEHIQNNCEKSKKREIYKNKCSVKGCRKKELIPVTCPTCKLNYCLTHRHEQDHKCEGSVEQKAGGGFLSSAVAALSLNRNCSSQARNEQVTSDEQLARALQQEEYSNPGSSQNRQQRNSQNNCTVS